MTGEDPPKESGVFPTHSPQETVRLGRILGELLVPGDVVALIGDLGAGKTTLAKGIARGAGVEDEGDVTSPTFVLVNEYQGRFPVYHADLYRLQEVREVEDLGWEEFIFGNGISLMEWAEKIPGILPEDRIEIRISWLSAEERKFVITGKGARAKSIVRLLQSKWEKEE
jgi:tRNA threonylcarbamoyladenosine biosynthesis protein TsaE